MKLANALADALIATNGAQEGYSDAELDKVYENIKKWFGEVMVMTTDDNLNNDNRV